MMGSRLAWAPALVALGMAACGGGDNDDGGGKRKLPDPPPPAELVAGGLVGPEGLCFDSAGNLYAGSTTGRITRFAPDGSSEIFIETGRSLAGLATGPQDEIFAAAFETGEVLAVSQDRGIRVATSGLDGPNGIVFDIQQRALVSALGLRGEPQIAVIEFDATYRTLMTEIRSPNGMAFGLDGLLYVADTFMNRIVRMEVDRFGDLGEPEVYASGLGLPDGIAFDGDGNLFVAGSGLVTVVRADGDRSLLEYATSGTIDGPASVAFGSGQGRDVNYLFFTNYGFPVLGTGTSVATIFVGIPGNPLFAPGPAGPGTAAIPE